MGHSLLCKPADAGSSENNVKMNIVSQRGSSSSYQYTYKLKPSIVYVTLMYNWSSGSQSYPLGTATIDTAHIDWIEYPIYTSSNGPQFLSVSSSYLTIILDSKYNNHYFTILEIGK